MDSLNDMTLAQLDPEIQAVLDSELGRQRDTLEMIASENFVPRAVLEAQGSVLTNKYAEGYPGRRYYGGCEFVDVAESLAIERAEAGLRRRLRQRSAPRGRAGQRRRPHGDGERRRPDPGPVPGPRRPPDPRHASELLGQALQGGRLRGGPRDHAHRAREGPRGGPAPSARA